MAKRRSYRTVAICCIKIRQSVHHVYGYFAEGYSLNSDDGIALVKMPETIDPQGLANRFAEQVTGMQSVFAAQRGLINMHDVTPPLKQEAKVVYGAINGIAEARILPHASLRKTMYSAMQLEASKRPNEQKWHSDNNFLTAYLGFNQPGHTMRLPDGSELPLMELPTHHILFTRQREWAYMYPDFSLASGIQHKVDWQPQSADDFRTVGLAFIGK